MDFVQCFVCTLHVTKRRPSCSAGQRVRTDRLPVLRQTIKHPAILRITQLLLLQNGDKEEK